MLRVVGIDIARATHLLINRCFFIDAILLHFVKRNVAIGIFLDSGNSTFNKVVVVEHTVFVSVLVILILVYIATIVVGETICGNRFA